jgi:hypothetical protein
MEIDPVVALAEKLRGTEVALHDAMRNYEADRARKTGEHIHALLDAIRGLYNELTQTPPTSAMGAAEMVRVAAQRLPFSLSRYSNHFHEIADRLGAGRREHTDLVWLRAMQAALKDGHGGSQGQKAELLLTLAIQGAARPVVVFRAYQGVAAASHPLPH